MSALIDSSAMRIRIQNVNEHLPGPTWVYLHGWGSNSTIWSPLIEMLPNKSLLIDLPGFGANHDIWDSSLDQTLKLLAEVIPNGSVMVGWSLGGMYAVQLAHRFPDKVRALITIASNLKFCATDDWPDACSADVYGQFFSGFQQDPQNTFARFALLQAKGDSARKHVLSTLQSLQSAPGKAQQQAWLNGLEHLNLIDNRSVAPSIQQPWLNILGENDALVPNGFISSVNAYSGWGLRNIAIESTGHVPHVSQAGLVASAITTFFNSEVSPYKLAKRSIAESFSRAAQDYDDIAELQHRVADQLIGLHTDYSGTIADLGCGTGYCAQHLASTENSVIGLDIAPGMLNVASNRLQTSAFVGGDIEQLPFANGSLDGIVSSLSMQWCDVAALAFEEAARSLKPGAWMLVSTLGPGTLKELQAAWQYVDEYVHVNQFTPLDQLEIAATKAGLKIEFKQEQHQCMWFDELSALTKSIKGIGAHNVNAGQNKGLTSRAKLRGLKEAYEQFREEQGLPLSYQVIYLKLRKPLANDEGTISNG